MSTKSISKTIADLRAKLAATEGLQAELNAEVQEVSYLAHTGDAKSKKRLEEIGVALSKIDIEVRSLTAAVATAARMEVAEQETARAEHQRANAHKAEGMIAEAEVIAEKLDEALLAVRDLALAYELKMIDVRRLTGVGPRYEAVRIFLARALRTAVHMGPMHLESIAPGDRTTVQQASKHWAISVRNMIAATLNKTAATAA